MARLILRRVLWLGPTMLVVTFLVYVALRLGTNPVEAYERANPRASAAKIQQYRDVNDLHPGVGGYLRGYWGWLTGFVTGDWPRSITGRRAVWPDLRDSMLNTLRLGMAATVVGVVVGLGLGVAAALRPGSLRDTTINTAASIGFSVPSYVSAVLLQLLFAVMWTRWFGSSLLPTSGVYPPGQRGFDLWLMLRHMILPVTVVAIQIVAIYARLMRASLLDVLHSDYLRTARAKGISERQVLVRHAVRNALNPVATVGAIQVGAVFGGLIITERVFSYPGLGDYFLTAFANGDFPQLMPFMVVVVVTVVLLNLLADLSYAWIDPRVCL